MENNVKFCVYPTSKSAEFNRIVVSEVASLEKVPGFFEVIQPTLETELVNGVERDRLIRHRVVVFMKGQYEAHITEGAYIQITNDLHPDSFRWRTAPKQTQYRVVTMTRVYEGRYMNLGLVEEDKE